MMDQDKGIVGLLRIWREGEGVHKVSLLSLIAHVIRRAGENLRRARLTTSLTVVTIAVSLSVLSFFALVISNFSVSVQRESEEMMVMVFLRDSATKSDVEGIQSALSTITKGLKVTYTDKNGALESFRAMLGDDAVMLEGIESQNPLPASLNITIDNPERADQLFADVSDKLAASAVVENIRYSRSGVQQLKKLLTIVEVGGAVGMAFLLIITGFIIANTIKLALFNHRMEIEIMELVGARRGSIYAPYVLEGFAQGVVGAAIGIAFIFSLFLVITEATSQSELLQMVFPSFHFLSLQVLSSIVAAGALVGMGGSFLAVRGFLSEY